VKSIAAIAVEHRLSLQLFVNSAKDESGNIISYTMQGWETCKDGTKPILASFISGEMPPKGKSFPVSRCPLFSRALNCITSLSKLLTSIPRMGEFLLDEALPGEFDKSLTQLPMPHELCKRKRQSKTRCSTQKVRKLNPLDCNTATSASVVRSSNIANAQTADNGAANETSSSTSAAIANCQNISNVRTSANTDATGSGNNLIGRPTYPINGLHERRAQDAVLAEHGRQLGVVFKAMSQSGPAKEKLPFMEEKRRAELVFTKHCESMQDHMSVIKRHTEAYKKLYDALPAVRQALDEANAKFVHSIEFPHME